MKISDLIQELEDTLLLQGDMGVVVCDTHGDELDIEGIEVSSIGGSTCILLTGARY